MKADFYVDNTNFLLTKRLKFITLLIAFSYRNTYKILLFKAFSEVAS